MNQVVAVMTIQKVQGLKRGSTSKYLKFIQSNPDVYTDKLFDFVSKDVENFSLDQLNSMWELSIKQLEESTNLGLTTLLPWDNKFPKRLLDIPNQPLALFAKGDLDSLNSKLAVAVIGTREPTDFGKGSAYKIASYLAEAGVCVVSGLAKGCDTLAHLGSLNSRGQTVAVLAHGLDMIYPSENKDLAKKILDRGGCLLSEYPPGTKPAGFAFIQRDRLQSGLSDATIVIETGIKGGTLHTANYCLKQGRMLGVVSHPDKYNEVEKSLGNKMLIQKKGGLPIKDRQDLEMNVLSFLLKYLSGERNITDWKPEKQLHLIPNL